VGALALTVLPATSADAFPNNWLTRLLTPTTKPAAGVVTTTVPTTVAPADPAALPQLEQQRDGAPTCGGATITKADGSAWRCTFNDEFAGTSLDRSTWFVQTSAVSGFGSHDDCYVDDPDNIAVRNGVLELSVLKEASPFVCNVPKRGDAYTTQYTSASINTYQRWAQAFGRFEIRAKFPASPVKGLHGAFWLWPDNPNKYGPWPMSGEIDIAEVFSQYNDRAIPYFHYLSTGTVTNNYCTLDRVDDWHTYTLEWTTTALTVSYDGKVCLSHKIAPAAVGTAPQPFDSPFIMALMEGMGVGGNSVSAANLPPTPATMTVDYVRVWQ
jgi:beta-glucanase (GH16 family)